MAFPSSPVDGQIYKKYKYSSANNSWEINIGETYYPALNASVFTKSSMDISASGSGAEVDFSSLVPIGTKRVVMSVISYSSGGVVETAEPICGPKEKFDDGTITSRTQVIQNGGDIYGIPSFTEGSHRIAYKAESNVGVSRTVRFLGAPGTGWATFVTLIGYYK